MITHPLVGDLSEKSLEELQETISNLSSKILFASRTHNQPMMNQLIMVLNSYKAEYGRRQVEMLDKKSKQLGEKIDIK
jgi:hypothetical protein